MHLKLKTQNHTDSLDSKQSKIANRKSQNMASSLVNDDEDNASSTTRNTQQPQSATQTNNNNNTNAGSCLNQQSGNNSNNNGASAANTSSTSSSNAANKMHPNEAKAKKENLQQRKLELEKLLNEKNWLLQQLQKQETEILNGNFEYMNFNEFIHSLNTQYKQEQATTESTITGGSSSIGGGGEEAILRRKPLTAKENQQHHNVLHRRQSEISNRSSEYDNYPHQDNLSTHSEGAASGGGGARGVSGSTSSAMTMQHAQQAQQQYNAKSALKKRSATVAGTTQQSATSLQMIRQQHYMEHQQQLMQNHNLYKQQHYHHPQQHLFKQHIEHHQVLMPHLQYATQKFYYTTLQPTQPTTSSAASVGGSQQQQQHQQVAQQQQKTVQQQLHQQQQQYGRYIKSNQLPQGQVQAQQQQSHHHAQQQSPNHSQQQQQQHHMNYNTQSSASSNVNHQQQQQLLLTPPGHGAIASHMDNISLYSLNSNNVATLHRQAQQQQPVIVQCDKYYLSPTSHHVSHNDGGGFIKSSQNIKEYISPMNSPQQHPQQLMGHPSRDKRLTSQTNLSNRVNTPSIDAISLAPSYVSMETVDYMTIPTSQANQQQQQRWKSQTNLPPSSGTTSADMKSYSSDMLNNNQYYNTSIQPPPPGSSNQHPPHVTQVKPFKPLDDISINSGYSTETQKKTKPKQWLESSLDGPVIRQTNHHHSHAQHPNEENYTDHNSNTSSTGHQRSKLSSHSLNTSRHYSMSAAAASHSPLAHSAQAAKLSQSTSYLNQMDAVATAGTPVNNNNNTPSISQAYNIEIVSPQTPIAYKFLPVSTGNTNKPPARPPLYINATTSGTLQTSASPTTGLLSGVAGSSASALSPDIRVESPKNVTVVQPATFQPYKEVTKPFEMSDFYKYSTKYRQKENNNNSQVDN
ncbi:putative uncharacterized protein DDB_G0282133 [Musca domestica]|uniref:Uncharacterized protein n=1 Tax=Musca domestica TaxID=7370 RepID=A0ABM3VHF5_MUSDO|nr:putative uncharacterized protein DDB_G0282133 [Musca domestica]XP_058985224.1 putative uncharacterized protein DDB_G0282133 [Musca domestica]